MIDPTVGRIVWYRPTGPDGATLAAIVCGVSNDGTVNLHPFGVYGENLPGLQGIKLRQERDPAPRGAYCEWMPYEARRAEAEAILRGSEFTAPGAAGPHASAD